MKNILLLFVALCMYMGLLRGMLAIRNANPRRWKNKDDSPYQQKFSGARF